MDNKLASQKDLISLHQEFEDVPIIDLKFIYKALACDYNRTVEFLNVNETLLRNDTTPNKGTSSSGKSESFITLNLPATRRNRDQTTL